MSLDLQTVPASAAGAGVPAAAVLVVEDNPITRKMLRVALESEGYRVADAGDGRAARAAAAARRPDVIVVDYVLPDVDGVQLLADIRRDLAAPELPAIVVTGMVSSLEALRAQGTASTQFLPKPVEPSRLLEIVRAHLSPARDGRGRTVLVLDDEPLNLKLTALRLRHAGYEVETAGAGEEALEKARRRPPDAFLSDVLMSSMDGFAFCGAVRRDPRLAGIPVVLVSASYAEEGDRELARKVGANALVARTGGLRHAIEALDAALRTGGPPPAPQEGEAVAALHRERIQTQLDRQAAQNQALLRQAAVHATALSVLRSISEALAQPQEMPKVIAEVLVQALDAAGLSTGLLYLGEPGGRCRLQAVAGIPAAARGEAERCFGHPGLIQHIVEGGRPVVLFAGEPGADRATAEFLAGIGRASVLAVPFVMMGKSFGALVLASDSQDLTESSWMGFAQSLALHFGQTVALAHSLTRLTASEMRYRALMEQANDAILILDLPHRILEVNREAQRLLGRSREELVGLHYDELVAPEEREDSARLRESLLADGTLRVGTRRFRRADGSLVPVEVSASLARLGEESTILAIVRDVTERQRADEERTRAEAALREAQQRLQHVVSSSPAVLYSHKIDNGRRLPTWVSDNILRLTGHAPADALVPTWWSAHVHPDDRDGARGELAELLATGSLTREYRLLHRDGSHRWVRDEQIAIRDAAGHAVEIVGSWSDVTARKQIELRLLQSEEQYRLLFDFNPQPMWVYDDETLAFLAVNDSALRHYGYSRAEFLALTVREIRPAEESPVYEEHLARRRAEGERKAFQSARVWKHRRKDGSLIDVEIAVSPIEFQGRQAWLALASDVTERKLLEAQFLQAQKMESVGRLAGGVAHDFNNLLTAILGYSQLLAGRLAARPDLRKNVEEIRRAGERAAALTRQLLAFSRNQVLQPQVVDLNAVVADVENMLRRLIGENIELVTVLRSESGRVLVDPGQLEQVIVNLAVNAHDAMPAGGRLLFETADVALDSPAADRHPGARPGPGVLMTVSDTGVGMDAETRSHIFEPFFTTKERGKGTGLGLSTVYGIVEQSGGHIEVASEPGQGTTFKIYFPLADGGQESPPAEAAEQDEAAEGSGTVLVFEDDAALRELVRAVLESAGYTVLDAPNVTAALELAGSHAGTIDLVLTDVIMPGMSGPEVAARLASTRPEARVLYISGYSRDVISQRSLLPSGVPLLEKPFTVEGLLQKVREVLAPSPNGAS
jgi:two-component system cell cycle sensor histidine kinase/response regulator CckA